VTCALVVKVKGMLVNWAARGEFENRYQVLAQLDTGAHAGHVPFLPRESIGTASECTVSIGQNKTVSWLPPACFD
jgi:hypothetical protein